MNEKCETVMTRNVQTCSAEDSAEQAARLMRDRNIGLIPIIDKNQKLTGVVTDRDLAVRVLAERKDGSTQLASIMSQGAMVQVRPDERLGDAEERMMKAGTSRAIVVDSDNRVIGVISASDICAREEPRRTAEVLTEVTRGHRVQSGA